MKGIDGEEGILCSLLSLYIFQQKAIVPDREPIGMDGRI
jgi:hypothetical protein